MKQPADYILCIEKGQHPKRALRPASAWYFDGEEMLCSYTVPSDAWMKDLTFDEVEAILIANNVQYTFLSRERAENLVRKEK